MRAVLVIDMPKSCAVCPIFQESIDGYCPVGFLSPSNKYEIPKGCPLKPLPQKLDANDWHRMFSGLFSEREAKGYGWNACLKEIDE